MATVKITDDFDMKKIAESGQCFRAKEIQPGLFRFVKLDNVVYIRKIDEETFDVSCNSVEWQSFWKEYFDLDTNYAALREEFINIGKGKPYENYLTEAINFGKGIRILRQEPFETLISFIISQRKNIPAIRKSIELLCEKFGRIQHTHYGNLRLFPTADALNRASTMDLSNCALGYRGAYIRDAVDAVISHSIHLDELAANTDHAMLGELEKIKGVGKKIANCVALYAYHRMNLLPVDVWIHRAIDEDFHGENIFQHFGEHAGLLQQYIFFYKRLGDKGFGLVD